MTTESAHPGSTGSSECRLAANYSGPEDEEHEELEMSGTTREETQISEVLINVGSDSEKLATGMKLRTNNGEHSFHYEEGKSPFATEIQIRPGDRLLGISQINVQDFLHYIVCAMLSHMMGTRHISLVISRKTGGSSEVEILEIKATVTHLSRGDASGRLRSVVTVTGKLLPPLQLFQYKGRQLCWIKQKSYNMYLKVGKQGKIKMKALKNHKNRKFQFVQHTFRGTQALGGAPSAVYVCVFESVWRPSPGSDSNSNSWGGYVCMLNEKQVGLVTNSIDSYFRAKTMTSADSRFFYVYDFGYDEYCIQSIVRKDRVWTCNARKPILRVSRSQTAHELPGSFPDASFSIIYQSTV